MTTALNSIKASHKKIIEDEKFIFLLLIGRIISKNILYIYNSYIFSISLRVLAIIALNSA